MLRRSSSYIEIWEEEIQALLERRMSNKPIYDKIAWGMVEAGHKGLVCNAGTEEVLKSERKRDNDSETRRERKAWKLYRYMNEALANKPATWPATVVINRLVDTEQSGKEVVSKDGARDDWRDRDVKVEH